MRNPCSMDFAYMPRKIKQMVNCKMTFSRSSAHKHRFSRLFKGWKRCIWNFRHFKTFQNSAGTLMLKECWFNRIIIVILFILTHCDVLNYEQQVFFHGQTWDVCGRLTSRVFGLHRGHFHWKINEMQIVYMNCHKQWLSTHYVVYCF